MTSDDLLFLDADDVYELTMGVAEGRIDKTAVAGELQRIAKL